MTELAQQFCNWWMAIIVVAILIQMARGKYDARR